MKIHSKKTTQVNKPKSDNDVLAPQTPDTNRPDLGRPTPKVTSSDAKPKK